MIISKTKILAIIVLTFVFISGGTFVHASPMTLDEIIDWGLENAPAQKEMQKNLQQARRAKERVYASSGWQLDFSGNLDYDIEGLEWQRQSIELELDRNFLGGLNLQSGISYSRDSALGSGEQSPMTWDQTDYEPRISFSLGYTLYPWFPTGSERNLMEQEMNLKKMENTFSRDEKENILGWIEGYMNLVRIENSLQKARENVERVEEELEQIKRQKKIEEAGELALLDSRLALLAAENNMKEQKQSFEDEKEAFYRELGLPGDIEIELELQAEIMEELRGWVNELKLLNLSTEEIEEMARKNSPELVNLEKDIELAEKRKEWLEKEKHPTLNLGGSLRGWEDWSAGINVSFTYNLFDSGQHNLNLEEKEEELKDLKKDRKDLKEDLSRQLNGLLNRVESARRNLKEQELGLEKARLEKELNEKEFEKGLVTLRDYNQALDDVSDAEMDYLRAEDDLLMAKLNFASFLGFNFDW